jgi:hypothetical protein
MHVTYLSDVCHLQCQVPFNQIDSHIRNFNVTSRNEIKAKYGGRFMVTMLPGDGIGPEMMGYVKSIFK